MAANLNTPEVEIREDRLGSVTEYNGTISGLHEKCHLECLKNNESTFSQCIQCSSNNAMCQLSMIKDAAVVNHAPIGCSGDFAYFNMPYRSGLLKRGVKPHDVRLISTNLTERDMIYGGGEKLQIAIREAKERFSPKAIFITTSCAAAIIADDVQGIADELEEEIGIPVIPVFCEGFRSKIWATGFDAAYHGILRKIVKPPKEKHKDLINVINFWGSDIFTDLFGRIGLKPNYVVPFSTIEQLEHISEAAATVQICPTLSTYMASGLEKYFGVPEIKSALPYGIAGTDEWLREIGKVTGKENEVEELIKSEKERIQPELEALREKLSGKKVFVGAGAVFSRSVLSILKELHMDVIGGTAWHHDIDYDNNNERVNNLTPFVENYGDVNFSICNKQSYQLTNLLNKLKPDLFVIRHGGMSIWAAKLGIPTFLMGDEHFALGYEGILNYGRRFVDIFSNQAFYKNLKDHSRLPYTDWWLKQDAFSFCGGDK